MKEKIKGIPDNVRFILEDINSNILNNYITNLQEEYKKADNDRHELFERNEKAIEYIKKCQLGVDAMDKPYMLLDQDEGKDLLYILGGE